MSLPPAPPLMRRGWGSPAHLLLTLGALAVAPIVALSGTMGDQARTSVIQVAATYGILLLGFRLLGKRELSQLSPFELVTLMVIPEIMSGAVQGEGSLLPSVAGLSVILLLVLATSALSHRVPAVQRLLESSPTLLVADGKLLEANLNRERISPEDLVGEMHKQGIARLEQVRFAILETDGNISFVPR
jgi:uncharacterized membrane protein YcaP (DUF421 family)